MSSPRKDVGFDGFFVLLFGKLSRGTLLGWTAFAMQMCDRCLYDPCSYLDKVPSPLSLQQSIRNGEME